MVDAAQHPPDDEPGDSALDPADLADPADQVDAGSAEELPAAFGAALRRALEPPASIPAGREEAVRAMARGELARLRREGTARQRGRLLRITRWAGGLGAAAAAVLVALRLAHVDPGSDALDVDGDGRVDVVDAYLLARAVERGEAGPRLDLDENGVAERADAEIVLARVVGGLGATRGPR